MTCYTKLKKLDEIACLDPYLVCECGAAKQLASRENKEKF